MAKKLPDFRKWQNKYLKGTEAGLLPPVISFSGCDFVGSTKGKTRCCVCNKTAEKYTRKSDGKWYCSKCR